jgi:dimeric dUTPase (all-alpha-NTP-PPase superfamily)
MIIDTSLYMPHQKELDERIFLNHQTTREKTRHDRLLACCVELAEFVNETRCFKYWSLKPASELSVLLEEYADGLHFLNSLCIDLNISPRIEVSSNTMNLSDATLYAYDALIACVHHFDEHHLVEAYHAYAVLGALCGFTSEMIYDAYLSKHKKNHVRQDEHY